MPAEEPLRAGVIGVGTMGEHHARVYRELAGVELDGVADADEGRALDIAEKYGTRARAIGELFDRVDVASIAVPTAAHYDLATWGIDAGVDLLVEKPLVERVEHGRELVELAEANGTTLQVGHIERFNPVTETLQDVVSSLDVVAVAANRLGPAPERAIRDSVVFDLMIHDLDVALSVLGNGVEDIQAAGTTDGRYATATLEFASGVIGRFTASRLTQRKVRTLTFTATDCYVTVDYIDQSVQIHRRSVPEFVANDGDVRYRHESIVENPAVDRGEPLKRELRAFVEAVRTGEEPPVTARDGLEAVELARQVEDRAFERLEPVPKEVLRE